MRNILKSLLIIFAFMLSANFVFALDDSYSGIGVYLDDNREAGSYPTVDRVVTYSPASIFRIQPGDKIISVAGYDTMNMSNDDIISLLRGPTGSRITVIIQNNYTGNKVCTITRSRISESNPSPALYPTPYYWYPNYSNPYYVNQPYANKHNSNIIAHNQNNTHHYENPKPCPQSNNPPTPAQNANTPPAGQPIITATPNIPAIEQRMPDNTKATLPGIYLAN